MADKFIDVPLNNMNNWNRTIELSEFNNKVQDTFLVQDFNNIKNVLECNGSNDIKIDIVHEPILLPLNVKTELYTNEFQSKLEVKEEPIETIEAVNRTEARDYVGNDVIHKEIVYVDWLRSEDIVTSLDINKLDAGILFSYCQTCNEDYKWYCLKCYMLSYILDTSIIDLSKDRSKKTTPKFLTIRNALLGRTAVYALKGIPKNVKFGPFEGLEPIQTTSGCAWKLKEGKLLVSPENIDRSNWMQYINCSVSSSEQNLTIFQHDGNLYFRSSREINAGEELLVYYSEENNSGNGDVQSYCYPVTETVLETVYVCTFCCLGFSSEVYLQKHKAVCPNTEDKDTSKGIVQCAFCKIHLDAKENSDLHMRHCCVKYTWNLSIFKTTRQTHHSVEGLDGMKNDTSSSCTIPAFNCPKCKYIGKRQSDLDAHVYVYHEYKPFACIVCERRFFCNRNLRNHLKTKHNTPTVADGDCLPGVIVNLELAKLKKQIFKCTWCDYQTDRDHCLNVHVIVKHKDIVGDKYYKCSLCNYQTNWSSFYDKHVENVHKTNTDDRPYKCDKCYYRTNLSRSLRRHQKVHEKVESFDCQACKIKFNCRYSMDCHLIDKHTDNNGDGSKLYKCYHCSYQTNSMTNLRQHIKTKHNAAKQFKCTKCDYETKYKANLNTHLVKHINGSRIRQPH